MPEPVTKVIAKIKSKDGYKIYLFATFLYLFSFILNLIFPFNNATIDYLSNEMLFLMGLWALLIGFHAIELKVKNLFALFLIWNSVSIVFLVFGNIPYGISENIAIESANAFGLGTLAMVILDTGKIMWKTKD